MKGTKELDLRRPSLVKCSMTVCSTVGLMKGEPLSSPSSSSLASSQTQPAQFLKCRSGFSKCYMIATRKKNNRHYLECRENWKKKKYIRGAKLSDSCMHVVVGDGLSVCQSRYFCLFSAALLAARDTPHVIAGCLLSLAKKESGSGVCFMYACVREREWQRKKLEQLSWKLLHSVSTSRICFPLISPPEDSVAVELRGL